MTCIVCKINPQEVGSRCRTCYEYLRRTGEERPERLFARQYELNRRRADHGHGLRRRRRGPRLPLI